MQALDGRRRARAAGNQGKTDRRLAEWNTDLSAFILCRFRLGLAPGVLSRLSAENSLESARERVSASMPRFPAMSLTLPLALALLRLLFSPFREACNRPRSGGGGVANRAGVRVAGLFVSSTDRFDTGGGKGIAATGSESIGMPTTSAGPLRSAAIRDD